MSDFKTVNAEAKGYLKGLQDKNKRGPKKKGVENKK